MADDSALLGRLSLEDKVSLLSGKDAWSLPALPSIGLDALVMSDGPAGVKGSSDRPVRSPTMPCGTGLAATWNCDLVEAVGALLGETARVHGIHVLLAPATNMVRSPLGGRNFEYYSEDPFLAGAMTCAYVRGVQSEGVAATVKHFVCNDAETGRKTGSVEIDEQALREIYLLPFELAVRDEAVWVVMCAYNKLRGTYMAAHPLLDDVLRDEWGFTGVVLSDWGAVHDTIPSATAGLDVEMPGPPAFRGAKLVAAVRAGELAERVIDEKVRRVFRLARRTGALGSLRPDHRAKRSPSEAAAMLRRAAAESFVLLRNDGGLLPVSPDSSIAVLGRVAALPPLQGGGSANVGPLDAPSPLDGIRVLAGRSAKISYEDTIERAVGAARDADVAVVFAGLGEEYESEGHDRASLELPREQRDLIAAIAEANARTVLVLSVGAPVLLDCAERVPAILLVWYGGQELGTALAEVLFGRTEPGGRLPMTWPAGADDVPVLDPAPDDGVWHYGEGLFVGYRHFDRHGLEPAYCFGHGLGYTRFSYEDMQVERNGSGLDVSVRVRNSGVRRGKEVVQLYVGSEDPSRPPSELKAFDCLELDAGAVGELTFTLGERAFSGWDAEAGRFVPIPGRHEIAVGSSSRVLPLKTSVALAQPVGL